MTESSNTTNPEENQMVTNNHFGTIRAKVNKTKAENKTFVFDYESDEGEKKARQHVHGLRKLNGAIDSTHQTAKAKALEECQIIDAVKRELRVDVAEMISFHMDPINEKAARKEKEATAAEEIEKQRLRLEDAHQMNDLFNRERDVRVAEEKIAAEKEAADKIKEDARIEKERIDNEEKIKKEAAAKAKLEAEAKAKKEKEESERKEREAVEAKEKAEQATKDAAIKAEADKVAAASKVITDKKAEADRVEKEKQAAIIKAEKDTQDAIDKVKKDQAIKEAAAKKESDRLAKIEDDRISDVNYRTMINNKILDSLKRIGLSDEDALKTAKALINGQIIAVSVNY